MIPKLVTLEKNMVAKKLYLMKVNQLSKSLGMAQNILEPVEGRGGIRFLF